jgi:hypothetical protein
MKVTRILFACFLFLGAIALAADPKPYATRSGADKLKALEANGGNEKTEEAIAKALKWLDGKQDKKTGSWAFESNSRYDMVSATSLSLLPFLGSGYNHKSAEKQNPYKKTVDLGIKFLLASQQPTGAFRAGSSDVQSQAFATWALCEAYAMTGDKSLLTPTKAAVGALVKSQNATGGWSHYAGSGEGDTPTVGWALQALHAAKQSKDIPVPDVTLKKAQEFLDSVTSDADKTRYGHSDGTTTTSYYSSVALWSRYSMGGWKTEDKGFKLGLSQILDESETRVPTKNSVQIFHTMLLAHAQGGESWAKSANPKLREAILSSQVGVTDRINEGSWHNDHTMHGRLGTTVMYLLALQTYYRGAPPVDLSSPKKK